MATNGRAAPAPTSAAKFDPHFPAMAEVSQIDKELATATQKSLERIANLSIPVVGQTAKSETLDSAIEGVLTHGQTITFFGDLFSRFQEGNLSREEVDQKLVNWAILVPGIKEKFDDLPSDVRGLVEDYRNADLNKLDDIRTKAEKFEVQPSIGTQKKMAVLNDAWSANTAQKKYPSVVEQDGSPVVYVEKETFENWGQTVRNKPAVLSTLEIN
jgi:hypothetical protein